MYNLAVMIGLKKINVELELAQGNPRGADDNTKRSSDKKLTFYNPEVQRKLCLEGNQWVNFTVR